MSGPWTKYQQEAGGGEGPAAVPTHAPAPVAGQAPSHLEGPWAKYASAPPGESTPAPAPPAQERGLLDEVGRQVALTGRAAVQGALALPGMVSDAITGPINAGLDAAMGEGKGFRFEKVSSAANNLMNAAGMPQPENATERVVQDVVQAGTGAAVVPAFAQQVAAKASGPLGRAVGRMFSEGPGLQVASAGSGAAASGIAREEGAGAGAQVAAGVIGGLAPGFAGPIMKEGFRQVLRGGEAGRQRMAETVEAFEQAGTTPTLAQATDGRMARATESLLAKTPGGAGVIAKKAQRQADEMAKAVQQVSDSLAPDASAVTAGEAIGKGVKTFKATFKEQQRALYDQLDSHLPAGTRIKADRTREALAALNEDIPGSPALSKWFKNARIQGIEGGLRSDQEGVAAVLTRPGMAEHVAKMRANLEQQARQVAAANAERKALGMTNFEDAITPEQIEERIQGFLRTQVDDRLSYQAIKRLRTLVGREMEEGGLAADVPRSKWRALYAALSEDLGEAAAEAGPRAQQIWQRANKYTSLGLERLEQLEKVVARDAPEKVFLAATSGTAEGSTTVRRVMKSLPLPERKEVAAAVLQRLGRATPGQQNADADAFSSERFLTNLAKMSPAARKDIFGYVKELELLKRVTNIAKAAESRREGGRIFANPSGTASSVAQLASAGSIGAALMSGSGAGLAVAGGVPAAANIAARVVTNPTVVKGLAAKTTLRPGAGAAAVVEGLRTGQRFDGSAEQPMETSDGGNIDATAAVAPGDGGRGRADAGAGGGDPVVAGVGAGGGVAGAAGAPAVAGAEGEAVRDAAGKPAAAVGAALAGQIAPGNIDLPARLAAPVRNPDGSVSTVRSITIGTEQGEVVIPTVVNGKVVSDAEAIEHFERTGEHLGIFKDAESAAAYAERLHQEQAAGLEEQGAAAEGDTFTVEEKADGKLLLAGNAEAIRASLMKIGIPERALTVTSRGVIVKKAGAGQLRQLMEGAHAG